MATIRKIWRCTNSQCKNEKGKHRGYKKVHQGQKEEICKHCGLPMVLSENWRTRMQVDGATITRSHSPRKRDADDFIAACKVAIRSNSILPGEEAMIEWKAAVESFEKWWEIGTIKKTTAAMYKHCLKPLSLSFSGMNLQEIEPVHVLAYIAKRKSENRNRDADKKVRVAISAATINREISTLKRIFSLHCDWNSAKKAPQLHATASDISRIEPLPENNLKQRYLTDTEANRLLKAIDTPHLKLACLMCLHTGLRLGDLLSLTWAQCKDNIISIAVDDTKGKEHIAIPISSILAEELKTWKKNQTVLSRWVFPGDDPRKHITTIKTGFNAAREKAGLKDITFHTLRHTFASQALMNGLDLSTISDLLGHSDIKVTKKRYGHLSQEYKKAAMDKFSESFLGKINVT